MSPQSATQLFLCASDSEPEFSAELTASFPRVKFGRPFPLLWSAEFALPPGERLPYLAFVRQWLLHARPVHAQSIRAWADLLFDQLVSELPAEQPWLLHVAAHYGAPAVHHIGARVWHTQTLTRRLAIPPSRATGPQPEAGQRRCLLIRQALLEQLQRKQRQLLRHLSEPRAPFSETTSLVQLLLTGPEQGFVSIARAPLPFEQRHVLSPFVKGEVTIAPDKAAPSRAFAKLLEAEQRLGHSLRAGDSCIDLGAAPGSWTYVAAQRGLHVLAVDRSPLRADLMANPRVSFQPGDAFRFVPQRPVDWLLCDVIAPAGRTADLLLQWLRRGWCRSWVVTLKMQGQSGMQALQLLKRELPALSSHFFLTRLCANKKELCSFGTTAP